MSKRRMHAATDPAPPSFGGYYKNARNVAGLKLQTAAEALAGLSIAGLGIYGAIELDALWPLAVGSVTALLTAVHALALRQHTDDVVADLWRHEIEAGRDLDGDGHIGAPPQRVTRYINIGGQMEPFVEEDEPQPAAGPQQIVIDLVPGFEMSPADLAAVVELAEHAGLGRSKLVGARLASGKRFSKGDWERFTAEAARRGWIERGGNGSGGTWLVKPSSILKALHMAGGTGLPVQETGRPAPVPAADRSETGLRVGEGRA